MACHPPAGKGFGRSPMGGLAVGSSWRPSKSQRLEGRCIVLPAFAKTGLSAAAAALEKKASQSRLQGSAEAEVDSREGPHSSEKLGHQSVSAGSLPTGNISWNLPGWCDCQRMPVQTEFSNSSMQWEKRSSSPFLQAQVMANAHKFKQKQECWFNFQTPMRARRCGCYTRTRFLE